LPPIKYFKWDMETGQIGQSWSGGGISKKRRETFWLFLEKEKDPTAHRNSKNSFMKRKYFRVIKVKEFFLLPRWNIFWIPFIFENPNYAAFLARKM
jgi:hypothetical protein